MITGIPAYIMRTKTAFISMLLLVTLTALGSVYEVTGVPYMVFGAICIVTVLITFGKIKTTEYPVYIYGMVLALLWQTSMMGNYIIGSDIHGELAVANRAINQGWDWSWGNTSNVSLVIG